MVVVCRRDRCDICGAGAPWFPAIQTYNTLLIQHTVFFILDTAVDLRLHLRRTAVDQCDGGFLVFRSSVVHFVLDTLV